MKPKSTIFMLVASFMAFMVCALAQQPVFKSRVEVVQLDVSVLDKNRQPIRGLTQQDFTILDEGKPQQIVAFSMFDFGDADTAATGWMREIAPDVATNEYKESRLFVLIMDDALIPQDPFSIKASREIAKSIIEKISPDDLMAIVFTGDNRKTQDFTADKAKLLAAVEKFNPGLAGYKFGSEAPPPPPGSLGALFPVDTDLYFYQSSIRVLENLADYLASIQNRRKALFWVSPGVPMDLVGAVPNDRYGDPLIPAGQLMQIAGAGGCRLWATRSAPGPMNDLKQRTHDVFVRAQRANVTIYPIDPAGLGGLERYLTGRLGDTNSCLALHKAKTQADYLVAAAANTGGRTIMNTNEFDTGIKEVFAENESYYLIGFEPSNTTADGRVRRLDVKVNRPDVEIRARSSYYAPEPPKTEKKPDKKAVAPEMAALQKSMSGILPMAGMPMRASVAPFAVPGQRLSTVTVVLGITQPVPTAAANSRITETTELLTSAFTPEGDARGTQRHTAKVTIRAGANGDASYEALARIDLPPGRYQLRLAAHNENSKRDGSVFVDVTVPDYSHAPFSASPIVLGATPGRQSAPKDLLTPLLPFVPTAERTFARTDKVTSFLRLYQSGLKQIEGVRLTIRVRDAADQLKVDESQNLGVDRFAAIERAEAAGATAPTPSRGGMPQIVVQPRGLPTATPTATDQFANISLRTADVKYALPMESLAPGQYLLTVEATLGPTTIRRDVRFTVR